MVRVLRKLDATWCETLRRARAHQGSANVPRRSDGQGRRSRCCHPNDRSGISVRSRVPVLLPRRRRLRPPGPPLRRYLFDRRVKRNSVWVTEGCQAASLWSPPGDEHAAASPTAAHAREVMLADIGPDAAQRLTHYDTVVASSLADAGQEPYWYLGILASHPDHAGSGLGRAVMTTGIEHVRKLGRTALLDTSNPRDDVADGGRGERLVAGGAASGLLCHQITRQSPSAWV